jgi:benzoyl-CoA 2,3-dioxygenase component A
MNHVRQHLIDPVSCIRCDGCRLVCPGKAIGKIDGTLVIDFDLCDASGACVAECDTGAINSWRMVSPDSVYSTAEQSSWLELPTQADGGELASSQPAAGPTRILAAAPASALKPQVNRFRDSSPALGRVVANRRLTPSGSADIRHIVIDLAGTGMTVSEGQSVGMLAPGLDDQGNPQEARLYSVASPREGEAARAGHLAFTIKRVMEDNEGLHRPGVCSNHACKLAEGDEVRLTGPFGATFLLPEDPEARLLMICTGTGIAPMRGMIERRIGQGTAGKERIMLIYGGRTLADLPYLADLQKQADAGLIKLFIALSREGDTPRRYVQDVIAEQSEIIDPLFQRSDSHVYLCGLVAMEAPVIDALSQGLERRGEDAGPSLDRMRREGRLHVETY